MFNRNHQSETYLEVKSESHALAGKHARYAVKPLPASAAQHSASAAPHSTCPLPAVNAVGAEDLKAKFNEFFRMGAAVAVGELFSEGMLGWPTCVASDVRAFLESFGVANLDEVRALGITGPYLDDFEMIFSGEVNEPPAA